MRKFHFLCALPVGCILLAACGSGDSNTSSTDGGDDGQSFPADDGGIGDAAPGADVAVIQDSGSTPPESGSDAGTAPDVDVDATVSPDASDAGDAGIPGEAGEDAATGDATVDAAPEAAAPIDAAPEGSAGDAATPDAAIDAGVKYAIGGTVTGLGAGDSVVLQNNTGDNVTVSAATFTFPTHLASGAGYSVTVLTSPTAPIAQTCTVTGGATGTVAGANVTDVTITCQTKSFHVGATVTGAAGSETVTLVDDLTDTATVGNGSFNFATSYRSGATYTVTATTQPTSPILQTCTVAGGAGTVGNADVNVAVTCVTNPYALGGTVHGLAAGKSLVLTETVSGQALPIAANGAFTFTSLVPNGNLYAAVVSTQPTNASNDASPQVCNVVAGAGTMPQSALSNIQVYCGTNCAAVHSLYPLLGSGNFQIDPDGSDSGGAFQAYCDMNFGGGGWTLIESTNGGACGPGTESSNLVVQGSCTYTPLASVEALANLGTTVHVRSASGASTPTQYATSATALPIGNLRIGALLNDNEDPTTAEAQWTTANVPAAALDFTGGCFGSGPPGWPNVYWASCNGAGWHLVSPPGQGDYSTWQWQTANVAMEVYVR